MSVKQIFLDTLRADLRKYPSGAVDDYIDYYDELISERVASGEAEADVVRDMGAPKAVANSFKQDTAIDRALKKPTLSNGVKALIAVLGVLSLPFLVPVLAVLILLSIVAAILFVCGIVVLLSGAAAAVFWVIEMAIIVFSGDAPFYLLLLVTGAAVIAIVVVSQLLHGLIFAGRWGIHIIMQKLKARRNKKQNTRLTSEDQ